MGTMLFYLGIMAAFFAAAAILEKIIDFLFWRWIY